MEYDIDLNTSHRSSYPSFDDVSRKAPIIINDLFVYLGKGGNFYNDFREETLTNILSGNIQIVPIFGFANMECPDEFYTTVHILHCAFRGNLLKTYIMSMDPDTDLKVYKTQSHREVHRAYLPLVLSHPVNMSGVWTKSRGVCHYMKNLWRVHKPSAEHTIFNYSKGKIIVLVVEFASNVCISIPRNQIQQRKKSLYGNIP